MNREHKIEYFMREGKHLHQNSPGNRGIEAAAERYKREGTVPFQRQQNMKDNIEYYCSCCDSICQLVLKNPLIENNIN